MKLPESKRPVCVHARFRCLSFIAVVAIAASGVPARADPPSPTYALDFKDEFNAPAVDPVVWYFRSDEKGLSTQLPQNVVVADGQMRIEMKKEVVAGKQFTGGGLISRRSFRYGYYEARIRNTSNLGWHAAFWMQKGNGTDTFSLNRHTEIDVFELENRRDTDGYATSLGNEPFNSGIYIWSGQPPAQTYLLNPRCSWSIVPKVDTTSDHHVFGAEWLEDEVKFFLDGKQYCSIPYPADRYQHDAINIWITQLATTSPTTVGGSPQLTDYVRYYVRDYYINPGDAGYSEPAGRWRDGQASAFGRNFAGNAQRSSCGPRPSTAEWAPSIRQAGRYKVQLWHAPYPNADPQTKISVGHAAGVTERSFDLTASSAGWLDLGTYRFATGAAGKVTARRVSGCLAAGMVRFVRQR